MAKRTPKAKTLVDIRQLDGWDELQRMTSGNVALQLQISSVVLHAIAEGQHRGYARRESETTAAVRRVLTRSGNTDEQIAE